MSTETDTTSRPFFKRHRDDDYIDEVRIIVRERYKTSGMSGDEWRFARVVQLFRKGRLLGERAYGGTMETVAGFVPWAMVDLMENGDVEVKNDDHLCFQPGCANAAVAEYEIVEEFGRQGERLHPDERPGWSVRRRFCQRHLRRGDCGREDSDANYRAVSGLGPEHQDWTDANIRESSAVHVAVDSLDELPDDQEPPLPPT